MMPTGQDSEPMIAGKMHSEILAMVNWKRGEWYKTITKDEKIEAMQIVEIAKRAKISAATTEYWKFPENKAKRSGKNNHMYGKTFTHTDASKAKISAAAIERCKDPEWKAEQSAAMIELWKDPEFRAEQKARMTGENNPSYIDGRKSNPQYHSRQHLRRLGLPEDFIEAALLQKEKRTNIEMVIEYWLINHEVPYEFQRRIDLPSTHTTVDFFVEPNFCIYADGELHINNNRYGNNHQDKDFMIDKELMGMGFIPLRLWWRDILDGDRPWLVLDTPQPKHKQQTLELREKIP